MDANNIPEEALIDGVENNVILCSFYGYANMTTTFWILSLLCFKK